MNMALSRVLSRYFVNCLQEGTYSRGVGSLARKVLPQGVIESVRRLVERKRLETGYLMNHVVSDLFPSEKWAILSFLLKVQRSVGDVEYLEIGVYAGGTIRFLAEHTSDRVHFTGVDLFEDFVQGAGNTHVWKNYSLEQVAAAANIERAVFYKGDSVAMLRALAAQGKRYHLVFIDGNHTYSGAKADFEAAHSVLHPGGVVVFHNCSPGFSREDQSYILADGGPWRVTEELRTQADYQLEFQVDRIRIFKRVAN